jgi:KGK domain
MNENRFETLGPDDVFQLAPGKIHTRSEKMIDTVAPFTESMKQALATWPYCSFVTSPDGLEVSVLRTSGGGWQNGKLRMRVVVEFEPEPQLKVEQPSHEH